MKKNIMIMALVMAVVSAFASPLDKTSSAKREASYIEMLKEKDGPDYLYLQDEDCFVILGKDFYYNEPVLERYYLITIDDIPSMLNEVKGDGYVLIKEDYQFTSKNQKKIACLLDDDTALARFYWSGNILTFQFLYLEKGKMVVYEYDYKSARQIAMDDIKARAALEAFSRFAASLGRTYTYSY